MGTNLNVNFGAIECLCIEITKKSSKNMILNLIYRPWNGDTTIFEKYLKDILSINDVTKKEVIIAGDFNINFLAFSGSKKVQSFVNLMFHFGMIPTINKPTRVTRNTSTAIDHIVTNSIINTKIKTVIVKTDISDHFPIFYSQPLY